MAGIRAVVFDLDGTLVDSAPDLLAAANTMLAELGRRALSLDEVIAMIGDGVAKLVERALAATGGLDGCEPAAVTQRFVEIYEGHAVDQTRPYPGVTEVLDRLQQQGVALGICTNKPEAATLEVLRDLDLARYFTAVIGGDSLDGARKPDPQPLLTIVHRLGATAAEAVMVGDNANDVQAARAAGMPVIVHARGYTRVPAADLGADAVIDGFADLHRTLQRVLPDAMERTVRE